MRVIDSSAWIEWLIDSPVGQRLADQIPAQDTCIFPTIVQLELSKWLTREKGEEDADRFIAYTMKCVLAPLDTAIALRAAECSAPSSSRRPTQSSTPQRWNWELTS